MALYPPAVKKLIPPGPTDPRITPRVVILHVDAGNADSLYGWFNGPSGGVESHFHVTKSGVVEQYRDTAWQADANTDANDFAISIETQGYAAGEWTPEQLASIKALILWCHQTHGIPLVKCPKWDGAGVGYHTLFPGSWDKRGASCPGPDRIRQFNNVIVPWLASGAQEDDMPYTPDELEHFAGQGVHGQLIGRSDVTIAQALERSYKGVAALQSQIAALTNAVQQLATNGGGSVDIAAVEAAAERAVRTVLGSVDTPA